MESIFRCYLCGRFISEKDISIHFDKDNEKSEIDSEMIMIGFPPEPQENIFWHKKCKLDKEHKQKKISSLKKIY